MKDTESKERLLTIIDTYVRAFESADPDLMASPFWLDDPRFVEVENHIAEPFGRRRYLAIRGRNP